MSDGAEPVAAAVTAGGQAGQGAGAMLRAARERSGLHIAALAASVKVTPRKLEALENDRWHELPDATFARALAQTICRQLKIDPQPVLAKLPALGGGRLEPPGGALNQPFRERHGRSESGPRSGFGGALRPLGWAAVLLLVGAVALLLMPDLPAGWMARLLPGGRGASAPAMSVETLPAVQVPAPRVTPSAAPEAAAAAVSPAQAVAGSAAAASASDGQSETVLGTPSELGGAASAPVAGVLGVSTTEPSWVEVRDGRGRLLLARTVTPGEGVGLDGPLPLRVTVGNAVGTRLVFRGEPVDVMGRSRENVARLELR